MKRRRLFPLLVLFVGALGATYAAACNDTALVESPDCHPDHCSCEQDPFQPLCRGFNDKPEGGGTVIFTEAGPDTSGEDAGDSSLTDAADAADGEDDSGDAAD